MNFLLAEGIHFKAKEHLQASGLKVESEDLNPHQLLQKKQYTGLGIRSRTTITKDILKQQKPGLKVIGAFCIGTEQIDLRAAGQQGVPVFNAPYGNTRSVAELVISHIISLSRQTYVFNQLMHQKKWRKTAKGNREIRGKTLGIVGYGHIGTQVGILAEAMGMQVLYFDIIETLPIGNAKAVKSLKELLSLSDFVSLHVPNTSLTKNMIQYKQLKQMRKNSFLINTSRGSVVNTKDLKTALQEKHIAGSALDVFPQEPENKSSDFTFELQELPQVILTPHIAGSTEEAQENIAGQVSSALTNYLFQGVSKGAVNFPVLSPPKLDPQGPCQRLVNIHKNTPGVLADINNLVSQLKININSQHLATNQDIGYLIMDIEKKHIVQLSKEINDLHTSIRTDILPTKTL